MGRGWGRSSLHLLLCTAALALPSACSVEDVVGDRIATQATPDSGSGAAAGADAGGTIDCSGALFCSDFEQGLGALTTRENDGALQLVSASPRPGSALSASIEAAMGRAYVEVPLDATSLDQLYLRANLWVPAAAALDDVALFYFGPLGDNAGVNIDLHDRDRVELFLPEHDVSLFSEDAAFERDRWQCLQLALTLSDTLGTARLSIDGNSVISASDLDTVADDPALYFTFGIEWSSPTQGPVSVLIDDVTLDDHPLECP